MYEAASNVVDTSYWFDMFSYFRDSIPLDDHNVTDVGPVYEMHRLHQGCKLYGLKSIKLKETVIDYGSNYLNLRIKLQNGELWYDYFRGTLHVT